MKLREGNTLPKYVASSYQTDLIPALLSLHQQFRAGPASWMMSTLEKMTVMVVR